MQKNDLVTVAIEDIGVGGEGIGRWVYVIYKRCDYR